MKNVRIGMIGFGNVGQGFVQIIAQRRELLREEYGINPLITAISDKVKGSLRNNEGLDLGLLQKVPVNFADFETDEIVGWDATEMIAESRSDVILELSVANYETGEPALSYMTQALNAGKSVITSNKGPIALSYRSLNGLAQKNGVGLGIEGTVMSGTPAIRVGKELLYSAGITAVRGIFNGTCNYILSEMKSGRSFEEALSLAQKLGFAEADPTLDISGMDSAMKIAILSEVLFGERIVPTEIPVTGISDLTTEDIREAADQKCVRKLIGTIQTTNDRPELSVKPVLLPFNDPLAQINGAMNAIQFETDFLGQVTLIGPGAGRLETADGLLQDLISLFREK